MDKELYIGVDVSKQTLDLAYYDGESIDWKKAHIKVSNNNAGFKKIGSWVAKVSKGFDIVLFCISVLHLVRAVRVIPVARDTAVDADAADPAPVRELVGPP